MIRPRFSLWKVPRRTKHHIPYSKFEDSTHEIICMSAVDQHNRRFVCASQTAGASPVLCLG